MKTIYWLIGTLSVVYAYRIDEDDSNQHNNSIHLDCFDVFIPLMNRLSNEAKEATVNCVNTASAEKERELTEIKHTRSELFSEVKRIKETLAHCSSRSDHLGYFECLNGIIEVDKKIVGDITLKSSLYSRKLKNIEDQEMKCFRNSVIKVKDKISNGINNLHYCLMSEENAETSATSGERLNHGHNHHSATESPDHNLTPSIFSQTTSSYLDEDYDYNNNNNY